MESSQNPLESLHLEADSYNKERLANALGPYVGIDKKGGSPVFKEEWTDLTAKQKIVTYLLYRRAAGALGHLSEDEVPISSKKVAEETGQKYNTVRPYFSELGFILKREGSDGYVIPGHSVGSAIEFLQGA